MKKLVFLFFSSLLGLCLGAGGSIGGGGSSSGDGSLAETENTRLYRESSPLMLTCDYNATNMPTTWKKNGSEIVDSEEHYKIYQNTSMYIASLKSEDIGEYSCSISGQETKKFQIVELFLHKHLPKSTTVLENDKLKLTCQVQGNPLPNVQWLKDGEVLQNDENSTRLVFEENSHHVPNASLLIKPILKEDYGIYICAISQFSIQLNTTTEVRVKDIYAALWPFLGIVAEVALLCAIIFIYEKRRIKPNLDRADMDDINDQKNAADQSKESEVRQRK